MLEDDVNNCKVNAIKETIHPRSMEFPDLVPDFIDFSLDTCLFRAKFVMILDEVEVHCPLL
jgi:hypothetical protein